MNAPAAAGDLEQYRAAIERALRECLSGRRLPFYDILRHELGLETAGGGREHSLAPILCLLMCDALDGAWRQAVPAASALELAHAAARIHQDIQDGNGAGDLRQPAWVRWGVAQAINAGDALACLATLCLPRLRPEFDDAVVLAVLERLQAATAQLVEGRYLEMSYRSIPYIDLTQYLEMVDRKTGALLGAAVEMGAMLAPRANPPEAELRRLGVAFGRLLHIRAEMPAPRNGLGRGTWPDEVRPGSLPVVTALAVAKSGLHEELLAVYRRKRLSPDAVQRIRAIFEQLAIEGRIAALAADAYRQACAMAKAIRLPDPGRRRLMELLHSFYGDVIPAG